MTLIKSIVLGLVLANIGYFLWTRGIAKTADLPAPTPSSTLKLASETSATAHPAADPVSTDPSAGTGSGAGGGDAEPNTAGAGSAAGLAGAGGGPEAAHEDNGAALLTNVKRCISVGPFRDVSEAAHAATTLRGGHYDPRQRVAEGEVWAGVWVYLPLTAARAGEDQILSKLKAGGFEDALEMPGPNDGSVISLGLYSDPKRAQSRVAQAQALGFNPATADRKRTGNVYWIDIDLKPTDSLLNPADLQGEAGRITRLEVKGCPSAGTQP